MPPRAAKRRPASGEVTCTLCKKTFNSRGYGRHKGACRKNKKKQDADLARARTDDAASTDADVTGSEGSADVDAERLEAPVEVGVEGPESSGTNWEV